MATTEERITYCRICEPLCGLRVTVEDGEVRKIRPDADHPLSAGFACPKGIAMADVQNDPERVLHPLRRNADGEFEGVSWDAALDEIGTRLRLLASSDPADLERLAGMAHLNGISVRIEPASGDPVGAGVNVAATGEPA